MPGPRFIDSVVGLIALQSIAFVLTWTAAFSLGARLRRGHWLASLAFLALVEAAALAGTPLALSRPGRRGPSPAERRNVLRPHPVATVEGS